MINEVKEFRENIILYFDYLLEKNKTDYNYLDEIYFIDRMRRPHEEIYCFTSRLPKVFKTCRIIEVSDR